MGTLDPIAKYSAFIGTIVANLVVYGLLAIFFVQRSNNSPKRYLLNSLSCALISFFVFLSLAMILLALTEGQGQSIGFVSLVTYLIFPQLGFGFTLYVVFLQSEA